MNEDQAAKIQQLMEDALDRLDFELKNQQPQHLPSIVAAIIPLYDYLEHSMKGQEKHHLEISLLNNVNKQVRGFDQRPKQKPEE